MKNNKGFTLIELLAVLIVLVAIMMIAVPAITSSVNRTKNKQNDAKIELILSVAEVFISDNKTKLTSPTNCKIIITTDLINKNYVTEKEVIDAVSGKTILTGCVKYASGKYTYDETDFCTNGLKCIP